MNIVSSESVLFFREKENGPCGAFCRCKKMNIIPLQSKYPRAKRSGIGFRYALAFSCK